MDLATSAVMRRVDEYAIHACGIPSLTLMENAGAGVVAMMERRLGPFDGERVLVACGRGNNGGDGFVIARLLHERGVAVRALCWAPRETLSPDCAANLDALLACGGTVVSGDAAFEALEAFDGADVYVDALLGTGAHGAPREATLRAVRAFAAAAEAGARIVAVDVPTGVDADTGDVPGDAVPASLTATLGLGKRGLLLYPGRSYAGLVEQIDIGIPEQAVRAIAPEPLPRALDADTVRALLPRRAPTAHKGEAGRVLIVGGSRGMTGAVALAARAAIRMGAGLVTVVTPRSQQPVVAALAAEPMTLGVAETASGGLHADALDDILRAAARADAVALGPGLGRDASSLHLVRVLLEALEAPVVLDADGLHALAAECGGQCHAETVHPRPSGRHGRELVLTPHAGEMHVVSGVALAGIEAARFELPVRLAQAGGAVVLLKGAPTVIAAPDGRAWVSTTGNPGMATGGAGDVLTGAIVALLGQRLGAFEAAACGAWVHGLAGDLAAERQGVLGLSAGDIVEALPAATLAVLEPWRGDAA